MQDRLPLYADIESGVLVRSCGKGPFPISGVVPIGPRMLSDGGRLGRCFAIPLARVSRTPPRVPRLDRAVLPGEGASRGTWCCQGGGRSEAYGGRWAVYHVVPGGGGGARLVIHRGKGASVRRGRGLFISAM